MKTATVSDFRARMKEHLEAVQKDQDVLIVSAPKKKDFVVITLEQYNAMEETAYLQSTPANAARLIESIEQDQAGIIARSLEWKTPTSKIATTKKKNLQVASEGSRSKRSGKSKVKNREHGESVSKYGRNKAIKKPNK